jgi:protein involved in polysaccharide export with SLBB domain
MGGYKIVLTATAADRSQAARGRLIALAAGAVLTMMGPAAAAQADETAYVLGPGDVLKLEVYGRSDLSGEFRVRPNGTIVVPLLGALQAGNHHVEQLEAEIAKSLSEHAVENASVIIEPVSLRPIYVVGDVTNQGSYPYVPGMRLIEAIALAGGYRSLDPDFFQIRHDLSAARADLAVLTNELRSNLARQARLEAERDGAKEIVFPEELVSHKGDSVVAALLDAETRLFKQRSESSQAEAKNTENQKQTLRKEGASLDAVMQSYAKQASLVTPQIESMQRLFDKGNAVKSQLLDLQLTIANIETLRLEASVNAARARERLAELDTQLATSQNERRTDVLAELREVQQQIPDVLSRLAAAKETLQLAGQLPDSAADRPIGPRPQPTIVRNSADGSSEVLGTEQTLILPGDVIKVPIE